MTTGILRVDWLLAIRDERSELSWRARAVAFALVTWADADGVCWPSLTTLARGKRAHLVGCLGARIGRGDAAMSFVPSRCHGAFRNRPFARASKQRVLTGFTRSGTSRRSSGSTASL